jgi:hypothetical protein
MRLLTVSKTWLLPLVGALLVIGWHERQNRVATRLAVEAIRLEQELRDAATLRAENERMRRALPDSATLDRLRSDHDAVQRLRAEFESLKRDMRARSVRTHPARAAVRP